MARDKDLDLSIVIPCYNEEEILVENIARIKEVMRRTNIGFEIILVDDCSKDKTVELASKIMKEDSAVRLIRHDTNMGRGTAVENGIIAARGKITGFLDIDLQVPAHYIPPIVMEIENGADVATALRIYDIGFHMLHRFIVSKGYHFLFDIMLKTGIKDSETGFKFFNRDRIMPVLKEIKDKRWFWDTEVMVRSYLKGYTIREIPCLCIREEGQKSTVKMLRDIFRHFKNLLHFKKEVDAIRRKSSNGGKSGAGTLSDKALRHPAFFDIFLKIFGEQSNVEKILKNEMPINDGMKILDLGCGTGSLAAAFPARNYIGIDLDRDYIEYASKRNVRTFIEMDAAALKFEDNSFDVIFVNGLFHHLPDALLDRVMSEAHRVLKATGKALVIEPSYRKDDVALIKKIFNRIDRGKHIREFGDLRKAILGRFRIEKGYIRKCTWSDNAVFVIAKRMEGS